MRVIGTAGHVDHGKSTLIYRLTGTHPDRLAEEQAREMTIDIGFAWMPLLDGERLGIIDVPGHRDFIDNLLAGLGGIDAVMLCVAADEGPMPQTREHLQILQLLGLDHGLIVMTRIDLAPDRDWLEMVEADIRAMCHGTGLENAPILRVSSRSSEGLAELKKALTSMIAALPSQPDIGQPRLAIDRVFTRRGFGTVITGTLRGGRLRLQDDIALRPGELTGRVRGLQLYGSPVDVARPGTRVAVNLAGIDHDQVQRGQLLTTIDSAPASTRIDVSFQHLASAVRPLKHGSQVKVFAGTAGSMAVLRLLEHDSLEPGERGLAQLLLEQPLPVTRHERLLVRLPSPPEILGGAIVIDPQPAKRWRRSDQAALAHLHNSLEATPAERLIRLAEGFTPLKRAQLKQQMQLSPDRFEDLLSKALDQTQLIELQDGTFIAATSWQRLSSAVVDILSDFHRAEPLRAAMPLEALRTRLGIKSTLLSAILAAMRDQVIAESHQVRLKEHQIHFSEAQQAVVNILMGQFEAAPTTPPTFEEASAFASEPVVRALIDQGALIAVPPDLLFRPSVYKQMVKTALNQIDQHGSVTVSSFRDAARTSRKYAVAFLEHLDNIDYTKRVNDQRVRGAFAPNFIPD